MLRSDPRGDKGVFTSDRDREWPLLQAMWDVETIEIPRPRWYDGTGERLGTKTIVMDHVEGTPLQLTLGDPASVAAARTCSSRSRPRCRHAARGLPGRHRAAQRLGQLHRQRHRHLRPGGAELADSSPIIRYVSAWLRANKPPPVPLSIVHGDFQPGNILVAEGGRRWSSTGSSPASVTRGRTSATTAGARCPNSLYTADPEAFLAEYRQLTGFTEEQVNPQDAEYFFVLGMAELFVQMMEGADAVGQAKGIMSPFLVNSMCYFHEQVPRDLRSLTASTWGDDRQADDGADPQRLQPGADGGRAAGGRPTRPWSSPST